MLALLILLLAPACSNADPPDVPPNAGMGWWQDETCTWITTDCLGAVPVEFNQAVRLPAGCKLYRPVVGMHAKAANQLFSDVAEARVHIQALQEFGSDCQKRITECTEAAKTLATSVETQARSIDLALRPVHLALENSKSSAQVHAGEMFRARVWQVVAGVAGIGAGVVIGILAFSH